MRRRLMILVTVVIIFGLTASGTLSAPRINSIFFTAVSGIGATGTLAMAGSDSLMVSDSSDLAAKGKRGQETCAAPCVGLFLHADGQLVGLGSTEETIVVVEATGIPVVNCTNQGGNQAAGQNPPTITTDGQQQIGVTQITKNGSAQIDVTTDLPSTTFPGSQMGCPNDNWTASVVGIQFSTATVSVFQNGILTVQESFVF